MPKGGSGFMRAAGRAASGILANRGNDWTVDDLGGATAAIQSLYGRTYRNGDVQVVFNSRGEVKDIGGKNFDRFASRAEALAKELSGRVQLIDREAERQYSQMRRWARSIRASDQERTEFERTLRGEQHFKGRAGKNSGDASEVARQMAGLGLISHEVAAMGNNVDIMNAINDAMNAVKGRIRTGIDRYGSSARADFEGDIFEGITNSYAGVVRDAAKRRK